MAFPQPFKTLRRTGIPSAGGNAHSLQAHIASSSAHPQYQKKGDEVGGVDLNAHESNVAAHRQHYLRRSELAIELQDFAETKTLSAESYKEGATITSTSHKTVVTAYLLNLLLNDAANAATYFPNLVSYNNVIKSLDAVSTGALDVPAWDLFKLIADKVNSHELSYDSGNPLADIFASKYHSHSGYALSDHVHRDWETLRNANGQIPAEADHDHDDRYLLKSESGGAVEANRIREVGIYPCSRNNSEKIGVDVLIDLNTYSVQGFYDFSTSIAQRSYQTFLNFPEYAINPNDWKVSITGDPAVTVNRSNSIDRTYQLLVYRSDETAFPLTPNTDIKDILVNDAGSYGTVTQMLFSNPAIKNYDRIGSDSIIHAIKATERRTYQRTGWCGVTAWYIKSILKSLLGVTPKEFYDKLAKAGDKLAAINTMISTAISSIKVGTELSTGFKVAQIPVQSLIDNKFVRPTKTDVVRAAYSPDARDGIARALAKGTIDKQSKFVAMDLCSWVIPGIYPGSIVEVDAASDFLEKYDEGLVFVPNDAGTKIYKIAPSIPVFVDDVNLVAANTGGVSAKISNFDTVEYYPPTGSSETSPAKLDKTTGVLSTEVTYTSTPAVSYIDTVGWILHEYQRLSADDLASLKDDLDVSNFYKPTGVVVDGVMTFTRVSNAEDLTGDNIYLRVCIVDSDGNRLFSKEVVKDGSDREHGVTYYTYNTNEHKFVEATVEDSKIHYSAFGGKTVFKDLNIYQGVPVKKQLEPVTVRYPISATDDARYVYGVDYEYRDEDLSKEIYHPIKVEKPVQVGEGTGYDASKYQYFSTPTSDVYTYSVIGSSDAFSNALANESVTVWRISANTGDIRYVPEGMLITGDKVYYAAKAYIGDAAITNVVDTVIEAFIRKTKDTLPDPNKVYLEYDDDNKRYVVRSSFVSGSTDNPSALNLYEIFDTQAFLNIWYAIHQLTTEGADITSELSAKGKFIYTFGEDGCLWTWDTWQKFLTADEGEDPFVRVVDPLWQALTAGNEECDVATLFNYGKLMKEAKVNTRYAGANNIDALAHLKQDGARLWFYSADGGGWKKLAFEGEGGGGSGTLDHTHDNLDLLNSLSSATGNWHKHANKALLDSIDEANIHEHHNKSVLDGLTEAKGKLWYRGAPVDTAGEGGGGGGSGGVIDGTLVQPMITVKKTSTSITEKILIHTTSDNCGLHIVVADAPVKGAVQFYIEDAAGDKKPIASYTDAVGNISTGGILPVAADIKVFVQINEPEFVEHTFNIYEYKLDPLDSVRIRENMVPDWSSTSASSDLFDTIKTSQYITPSAGFIVARVGARSGTGILKVNDNAVAQWSSLASIEVEDFQTYIIPVAAGDIVTLRSADTSTPVYSDGSNIKFYLAKVDSSASGGMHSHSNLDMLSELSVIEGRLSLYGNPYAKMSDLADLETRLNSGFATALAGIHTHDNKSLLDSIDEASVHKHNNKSALDTLGVTNGRVTTSGSAAVMQSDIVVLSKAEYDALATKDDNKLYFTYES